MRSQIARGHILHTEILHLSRNAYKQYHAQTIDTVMNMHRPYISLGQVLFDELYMMFVTRFVRIRESLLYKTADIPKPKQITERYTDQIDMAM